MIVARQLEWPFFFFFSASYESNAFRLSQSPRLCLDSVTENCISIEQFLSSTSDIKIIRRDEPQFWRWPFGDDIWRWPLIFLGVFLSLILGYCLTTGTYGSMGVIPKLDRTFLLCDWIVFITYLASSGCLRHDRFSLSSLSKNLPKDFYHISITKILTCSETQCWLWLYSHNHIFMAN